MGEMTYWSAGGTIRRTIYTDPSNPYEFTQRVSVAYPDDFAQRNRELGEEQKGSMKLIARGVPAFVYEQSVREEWDEARWARWLNDPDNAAFRVWRGTV
jgi:hypothetical protein